MSLRTYAEIGSLDELRVLQCHEFRKEKRLGMSWSYRIAHCKWLMSAMWELGSRVEKW